jgi:ApbE superfamily uncharacterized protein (UPF0280 family)
MASPRMLDVPFEDVILRVIAKDLSYEEIRAAAMDVLERIPSYGARNPMFARSKRPIELPPDAPAIARRMAEAGAVAGVGPMYAFRGALVEFVGRAIAAKGRKDVNVSCPGIWFVLSRKPVKLAVRSGKGIETLSVLVKPDLGPHGVYSSLGREVERVLPGHDDGVVVVANSSTLAVAAATAARAILTRRESIGDALAYLQGLPGLFGAMLVRGDQIGLAGGIELAA